MPGTPAASSSSLSSAANSQHVFAVNDICFHKVEGTFGTGGADGSITFWDGIAKTKLKRQSDSSGAIGWQ
jgi:mRNA export factor